MKNTNLPTTHFLTLALTLRFRDYVYLCALLYSVGGLLKSLVSLIKAYFFAPQNKNTENRLYPRAGKTCDTQQQWKNPFYMISLLQVISFCTQSWTGWRIFLSYFFRSLFCVDFFLFGGFLRKVRIFQALFCHLPQKNVFRAIKFKCLHYGIKCCVALKQNRFLGVYYSSFFEGLINFGKKNLKFPVEKIFLRQIVLKSTILAIKFSFQPTVKIENHFKYRYSLLKAQKIVDSIKIASKYVFLWNSFLSKKSILQQIQ